MKRIRPSRLWVGGFPAALFVGFLGLLVFSVPSLNPVEIAWYSALTLVSAVGFLYVWFFYFVEFDALDIHQSRYFGLGDKHIPTSAVSSVSLSKQPNASRVLVDVLCISAGDDELRLQINVYPRNGLIELVRAVQATGAFVDKSVLRELKIDALTARG